jgi:hypothetical protein
MNKIELEIPGLKELNDKIDLITQKVMQNSLPPQHIIYDNNGFQELLKISSSKASELRANGKIAYSKESATGKIRYRLSDILDYIDSCRQEKF